MFYLSACQNDSSLPDGKYEEKTKVVMKTFAVKGTDKQSYLRYYYGYDYIKN